MAVNDIITSETDPDPLIPTPVSAEVIKEMPKSSAVMSLARRRPMSTKTGRQPVLSVLPQAFFVSGNTGLKQTTTQDWKNVELVAEELAVIVPIPENYLDDTQVPIWDEVRPELAAAFGRAVDLACLFGTAKPSTWGDAIVTQAAAAGNTVTEGDGEDLADEVALLAQTLAEKGASPTGFAVAPGFDWRLVRLRANDGTPIYSPPQDAPTGRLYGRTSISVENGGWDASAASLIAGDWSKAILGVRADLRFKLFTEGVISDDAGTVVLNLMQQDAVALRATIRLGWALANPVNPLETDEANRSYFGVLEPAGS